MNTPDAAALPADLAAVAMATDGAVSDAAALPGAPGEPETDPGQAADELGDMLALGFKLGGKLLPPLAEHFDRRACRAIAAEFIAVADKYGWNWQDWMAGPELRLGLALAIPGIACAVDCRDYLAKQAGDPNKPAKQEQPRRPAPAPQQADEVPPGVERVGSVRIQPGG